MKSCEIFKDVGLFAITDFETTGVCPDDDVPIQVGMMITDRHLNIISTYSQLIDITRYTTHPFNIPGETPDGTHHMDYPREQLKAKEDKVHWHTGGSSAAAEVHGISPQDILLNGVAPVTAAINIRAALKNAAEKWLSGKEQDKQWIIVSDNIQFEYRFMKKLFFEMTEEKYRSSEGKPEWPFHYCGWDTSLLLELTGVGDPKNLPHDALGDVSILHTHLVRAFEKMGYYQNRSYPH